MLPPPSERFRGSDHPRIDEAMNGARFLRRLREAMPKNIGGAKDSEDDIRAFFRGGGVEKRIRIVEQFGSPDEIQSIRGWYLSRFIEDVTDGVQGRQLVNMKRMAQMFSGKKGNMFRREVFDRLLPGFREEFQVMGRVSERMAGGLARAEGSPTAGRLGDTAVLASIAAIPSLALSIFTGNVSLGMVAAGLLGQAGTVRLADSLVNGKAREQLVRLASGSPVFGPTQIPAAIADQGGALQAGQQSASSVQETVRALQNFQSR